MQAIGIIPARYASTRFPGKMLVPILGKPLLQWVFEAAQKSQCLEQVLIATDHEDIALLCQHLKAKYIMTEPDLPSGSDRVWAAAQSTTADVIVNIQGDEPLIQAQTLDSLLQAITPKDIQMATLGGQLESNELNSPNTVKVICNHQDEALYFSRLPIPYSRGLKTFIQAPPCSLKHIGVYAYKRDFLAQFCAQAPVEIEKAESLEQLRALYLGAKIKVVRTNLKSWGVDTPEDVQQIEKLLQG